MVSAKAILDMLRDKGRESGLGDYRLLGGYGELIKGLAEGTEVHLNTPVQEVIWSASGKVEVRTEGRRYRADNAVIAIPLGVLQGHITFRPGLPSFKRAALAGLRMGPVIKLIYKFTEPIVSAEVMAIYSRLNPPMWWSPSFGHDTEQNIWTAFVSGDKASELLSMGEEGALEYALTSLREELGRPDLFAEAAQLVNWCADPFVRGGYSYVLPGHEGARGRLATPTPPLYWAGEATEPEHRAATVHGALLSGRRAAAELLSYEGEVVAPIAAEVEVPLERRMKKSAQPVSEEKRDLEA